MDWGAGSRLGCVQIAADEPSFQCPLDLGARGPRTIGGNRVIRYRTMRDQLLGFFAHD